MPAFAGSLYPSDAAEYPSLHAAPLLAPGFPAWYLPWKDVCDRGLAAALLVVTGPLILAMMALVRLTSYGPSLYSQVRLGRGGRPYRLYKIRTMVHDCERLTGPQWSTADDPRVTALGRVLRDYHVDELPQLWNVLRGEMSLVGPRPERPEIIESLEQAVPRYRERLTVRPGITGLAQVQLPADQDIAGVRRKLACDLYYIRRMGAWTDLRLLAGTALKMAGVPPELRTSLLGLPGAADAWDEYRASPYRWADFPPPDYRAASAGS